MGWTGTLSGDAKYGCSALAMPDMLDTAVKTAGQTTAKDAERVMAAQHRREAKFESMPQFGRVDSRLRAEVEKHTFLKNGPTPSGSRSVASPHDGALCPYQRATLGS